MMSTRLASLVLPMLAACEEEPPPTLDCEGEEYAYYFYERDAVEADSACLEATVDVAQVMESPDIEGDEVQIRVSANKLDDVAQSPRICALALTLGEVPVEGAAGSVATEDEREGRPLVVLGWSDRDEEECLPRQSALPTGGSYRVLRGGWNDTVEVRASDMLFEGIDGDEFQIDTAFFRFALGDTPAE